MGIGSLINNPTAFLMQVLYSLPGILVALSFHEWGHAYAAFRCGDPTARNLGRMTVNPLRHLDPIGFISLLIFRFGWAKPVPVNPRNFKNYRRDDIIVSVAGVTVNCLLGIVGMLVFCILLVLNVNSAVVYQMLVSFIYINFALLVFNLIPVPPLDGSHVLENLLIRKVGPKPFMFLSQYGYLILLALMITGVISTILQTAVGWILNGLAQLFGAIFGLPLNLIF